MSGSTLSSWARAVWRALDHAGVDADSLFRASGLDPARLNDPQARYPVERSRELWSRAVVATGDEAFGLTAARQAQLTTFHALGFAVMASLSLRDAFERCARYLAVVSDAAALQLSDHGTHFEVAIVPRDDQAPPCDEAVDAFAGVFTRMARARLGRDFSPVSVTLTRAAPTDPSPWTRAFRCPVQFVAPENRLRFDAASSDRPLDSAHPELAAANEAVAERLLATHQQADWSRRVQALLRERLPQGDPGEAAIAEALHLSLRSLQRKLAEQHTSYGTLLRDTREHLARQYLLEGRHSVIEIAYLLGFGDASSFTRAFKRWTGVPPSQYPPRAS